MRPTQPSPAAIEEAAKLLCSGQLVAFPTETVYGLGADATNGEAVARIFQAKGRPRFNPLIAHVPDLTAVEAFAVLTPAARRLAAAFWPGPLTLVLPKTDTSAVSDLVTAGLSTIAVRVPAHPVALDLLRAVGRPVAAPSANRSGHVSATTAAHVAADLGDSVAMILDAGPALHGIESTILDATTAELRLLRPGAVPIEAIATILGHRPSPLPAAAPHRPSAPGQLESHYAPTAGVRLDATDVRPGEGLLAFGPCLPPHRGLCINLSPTGDLVEAAANLFSALREIDRAGVPHIAVMPIPPHGLGVAINDRLRRAAAPRPFFPLPE